MATKVAQVTVDGNDNKDVLKKIIQDQNHVIRDLQAALARMTADRDDLLTRLDAAVKAQYDKHVGGPTFKSRDIDSEEALCSSQSSTSTNSSCSSGQTPVSPVPPPRSPFRQQKDPVFLASNGDGVAEDVHRKQTGERMYGSVDYTRFAYSKVSPSSIRSSSLPVPTTSLSSGSGKPGPLSPDQVISSPVNAILDEDAQSFAKYQESVSNRPTGGPLRAVSPTSWKKLVPSRKTADDDPPTASSVPLPPPPPPPPSSKQQNTRHVRRASSQPVISQSSESEMENSLTGIAVKVLSSNITKNSKGKGVISFIISVRKYHDKSEEELWRIEKRYSDFLALDTQLKSQTRPKAGKISKLPDKALFATHTPSKSEQRKVAVEKYLQHAIDLPWQDVSALCDFLSSNRVERNDLQSQAGRKEGYLMKRGKNFGGWKTRYFILDGPTLRYYESHNGALLGTIHIPDTQIIPQHAHPNTQASAEMRHAFFINEPKRTTSPGSGVHRHTLCAQSDAERDEWIKALTQYLNWGAGIGKTITKSPSAVSSRKEDDKSIPEVSIKQHSPPIDLQKLSSTPVYHPQRSNSDTSAHCSSESTFPDGTVSPSTSRPLLRPRASMDQAFPSSSAESERRGSVSPDQSKTSSEEQEVPNDGKKKKTNRKTFWARKIFTGDMSASMPSTHSLRGFLSRSSTDATEPTSPSQQQGQPPPLPSQTNEQAQPPRVFGIPLEEAIKNSRVSEKCELPAVVYRCVEYLEAKNAAQEEGIYRLSGSAAKIKALKQQFEESSDVNLLQSEEYHDVHVVAGLLKTWLRELPGNVLTMELLEEFLGVTDLLEHHERVNELGRLVSMLPLADYTLLRVLCAHLIRVVQHADINKMTARNVCIIFSPTLKIPMEVLSLFLSQFEYIFWTNNTVDGPATDVNEKLDSIKSTSEEQGPALLHPTQPLPQSSLLQPGTRRQQVLYNDQGRSNRNSVHYMDGTPLSIVTIENGNAIIDDNDDDPQDLELDTEEDDEDYDSSYLDN